MQIGLNEAPNHYRITSTFQECKIISIFFEKFIIITTKNTIRLISFLFWSGISFYYIVQFYFLTLEPHERKKWIIFFISMQSFVIISPRSGNNKKTIEIFLSNRINIFIHNKRFKIRDSDLIQIHQTKAIHICIYVCVDLRALCQN